MNANHKDEKDSERMETVIVSAQKDTCDRNPGLKSLLEKDVGHFRIKGQQVAADRAQPVIVPVETVTHVLTYGKSC